VKAARVAERFARWRSYQKSYFGRCGPFKDVVVSLVATLAKREHLRTKAGLRSAIHQRMTPMVDVMYLLPGPKPSRPVRNVFIAGIRPVDGGRTTTTSRQNCI
jgi:hypothetical protein